ncbi:MAG TPA: threonine/serine dehydratase [Actinomycetota bacterium]|jgi:threonine dehydratase|nr:threonine/serine dehydratase [Actinomycetota bacterium]
MLDFDDVRAAAKRLDGAARRTPVLRSQMLDEVVGARVYLKAENHQRTGSFKFRGAYNRLSQLETDELKRGVVTISSGNHAQAVALAAKLVGTTSVVLMPIDAPDSKRKAALRYGAEIVDFDRYTEQRDGVITSYMQSSNRVYVPPYDHPDTMAGQGTAALELFVDARDLDVLIVPVSGGGLIAGCGTVAKTLRPSIHLVGVEPEAGDDTKRSLDAGRRVAVPVPRTIADGLTVNVPGELTFEVNRKLIDEVVLVSDEDIVEGMRFAFESMKTVVEPSGAASLAALLAGWVDVRGRNVGVILSGGNVGAERFAELIRE